MRPDLDSSKPGRGFLHTSSFFTGFLKFESQPPTISKPTLELFPKIIMSLTGPIVYVEDDEDDQYMMKGVIQDLQIPNQLRFFADGETAFDYLKATQEKPFLILCDINLPLLNGMELRRQIYDDEYLKKKCIPFIFISTAATPQEIEIAYDITVQGFFQKTTTFEGLGKQVKSIIAYWQESLHPNRDF